MAMSGEVDALWIADAERHAPRHHARDPSVVTAGRAPVRAVACEKPLARTRRAKRARCCALAEDAGLNHGYLENQVFSTAVHARQGDHLAARRAATAAGPIWRARPRNIPARTSRGSGRAKGRAAACCSDMMCHSVEVARFLLTAPGAPRDTLRLGQRQRARRQPQMDAAALCGRPPGR